MNSFSKLEIQSFLQNSECSFEKLSKYVIDRDDNAFFICDLGDIIEKFNRWSALLPRIRPFYAVKCNNDANLLTLLGKMGAGFDCASKAELETVSNLNVVAEDIVYANPCKQKSHIRRARELGVERMTFDNEPELFKIKKEFPYAKLILRIAVDDSSAKCQLGMKYGADLESAFSLLQTASILQLDVIGVSFHVGSGCSDPNAFYKAIKDAAKAFTFGAHFGYDFKLLDIGGGYPGNTGSEDHFAMICAVINESLMEFFPDPEIEIIAEPGRYFAASAFTLVTNVIARKIVVDKLGDEHQKLFINDGLYGSFNCLMFDHAEVQPIALNRSGILVDSSIWGPTCDGLDQVAEHTLLPHLNIGDWLVFKNMGAYTMSASSTFNGFAKPDCIHFISDDFSEVMEEINRRRTISVCSSKFSECESFDEEDIFTNLVVGEKICLI